MPLELSPEQLPADLTARLKSQLIGEFYTPPVEPWRGFAATIEDDFGATTIVGGFFRADGSAITADGPVVSGAFKAELFQRLVMWLDALETRLGRRPKAVLLRFLDGAWSIQVDLADPYRWSVVTHGGDQLYEVMRPPALAPNAA